MEKSQLTYFIIVASVILAILVAFLLFVFIWYRNRRNRHIREKNAMQTTFEHNLLLSRIEIQEQTFDIISQEIHDNVGQLLSLAKVQLSIIEQQETLDKPLLADIKGNISNALNDLRDIAKSLNNNRIQQLTLAQIIEEELQRISRAGIIQYTLQLKGNEIPLAEQKKAITFRMVQECLQNIIKHADATQINACLDYHDTQLQIAITDNGKGFSPGQAARFPAGLGLNNIKTRVALIGGSVKIESAPRNGTTITLNIPYAS